MNAVERLWRALKARNWHSALAQLHPGADIAWPHTGQRFTSREEYVTYWRLLPGERSVTVQEVITEGNLVAVRAVVADEEGAWHCGGFYELREARIAVGTELWVPDKAR
jgi:hypothetical protein